MCGTNTLDPLAKRLFEEKLCLVKVARSPEKLFPGCAIMTFPDIRGRDPVIHPMSRVLDRAPMVDVDEIDYVRIDLTESSSLLKVEAVVDIAPVLAEGVDKTKLKVALSAGGSENFKLVLGDPREASLDVGKFEFEIDHAAFTPKAADLVAAGARVYVVTHTVTANEVQITGDAKMDAKLAAEVPGWSGGHVAVATHGKDALRMRKVKSEMVIAFRALQIIDVDGQLILNGMDRPLGVRGDDRKSLAVPAHVEEFTGTSEELFVTFAAEAAD